MSDDGLPPVPGPFGRYRLLSRLGAGVTAAVYLAHDPQLDRRVALKIPKPGAGRDDRSRERFLRQARAAAAFVHPNVCPVYEVGECGGLPHLATGHVEGRTPAARLDPDRPPDVGWSAALVRTLARALSEAHGRGVVPRDLKPSNVMIDARGGPVLFDSGPALSTRGGDPRPTAAGALAGTPAYLPPEYARGGARADPAGGVYSLGAVLYELLTGRPPFVGDSVEVLARALCAEPEPPPARRPGVPPELDSGCLTALAKEPEDRFASMDARVRRVLRLPRRGVRPADGVVPEGRPDALVGRAWGLRGGRGLPHVRRRAGRVTTRRPGKGGGGAGRSGWGRCRRHSTGSTTWSTRRADDPCGFR